MNSETMTQLLYCFCVLNVLLLAGTFLRGVAPAFRKLFLPASVIDGFLGLLIDPIIQKGGGIPFPSEQVSAWAAMPGILIMPAAANVPLGMKFGKKSKGATKAITNVMKVFAIMTIALFAQTVLGIRVRQIFDTIRSQLNLYPTFGYELPQGYTGGPGTAGVIGSFYRGLGLPYWQVAQRFTSATATFEIVGGMVLGIISIDIAARRRQTTILSRPSDILIDLPKGFQKDLEKQKGTGEETTLNSSVESLSFHLIIILTGCGLVYVVMSWMKGVPGLSQIPIWVYAIVVMFGVGFIIQKPGLGSLVDDQTKSRTSGALSDCAIVALIASLPVHTVLQYIVPLLVLIVDGYVVTYAICIGLNKVFFKDHWFERSMTVLGTGCDAFLTGLMLLKVCGPGFKSPVLNDYSIGFSLCSASSLILLPVTIDMMLSHGFGVNMLFRFTPLVIALIVLTFVDRLHKSSGRRDNTAEET